MKERKQKVTRLINGLIADGYFENGHSLSEITNMIVERSGETFYSNQVSGIVLVMVRERKLSRATNGVNGLYVYSEGSVCPK